MNPPQPPDQPGSDAHENAPKDRTPSVKPDPAPPSFKGFDTCVSTRSPFGKPNTSVHPFPVNAVNKPRTPPPGP